MTKRSTCHFCLHCDEYLPTQALTKEGDPKDPDWFCRSRAKCEARKAKNEADEAAFQKEFNNA
jgi:hypothetical protein